MTKELGDEDNGSVDDEEEARVSFIYHFNIYLSSSPSSSQSLRTERAKRRTAQNNNHKKRKKK